MSCRGRTWISVCGQSAPPMCPRSCRRVSGSSTGRGGDGASPRVAAVDRTSCPACPAASQHRGPSWMVPSTAVNDRHRSAPVRWSRGCGVGAAVTSSMLGRPPDGSVTNQVCSALAACRRRFGCPGPITPGPVPAGSAESAVMAVMAAASAVSSAPAGWLATGRSTASRAGAARVRGQVHGRVEAPPADRHPQVHRHRTGGQQQFTLTDRRGRAAGRGVARPVEPELQGRRREIQPPRPGRARRWTGPHDGPNPGDLLVGQTAEHRHHTVHHPRPARRCSPRTDPGRWVARRLPVRSRVRTAGRVNQCRRSPARPSKDARQIRGKPGRSVEHPIIASRRTQGTGVQRFSSTTHGRP